MDQRGREGALLKTAAVPSGPALIATDSEGLYTELCTEGSAVIRPGLLSSTERHVLCVVGVWHIGHNSLQLSYGMWTMSRKIQNGEAVFTGTSSDHKSLKVECC